jgi:hypothetical protein
MTLSVVGPHLRGENFGTWDVFVFEGLETSRNQTSLDCSQSLRYLNLRVNQRRAGSRGGQPAGLHSRAAVADGSMDRELIRVASR